MLSTGLMISAYAKAGAILGDETYIQRALQTVAFIREHLCDEVNGELLRSCYVDENGGIAQMLVSAIFSLKHILYIESIGLPYYCVKLLYFVYKNYKRPIKIFNLFLLCKQFML